MVKICFIGAGSTIFAKNVLGDAMLTPSLQDAEIALYDIDENRLKESELMLQTINKNSNQNRAKIQSFSDRKEALKDANFVINAIQVGGYKPSTVIDFEIPKKYGLQQTIGDTTGIGGIFRGLRTLPVMFDIAKDMEEVCPDAWLLNYTNPMAILTMGMLKATKIKTVGLCHSVQVCVRNYSNIWALKINTIWMNSNGKSPASTTWLGCWKLTGTEKISTLKSADWLQK